MLIQINKEVECFWPVKGYEGFYEVSNLGRVKSLKRNVPTKDNKIKHLNEKFLSLQSDEAGYFHVRLCKNNIKDIRNVHRLVAEAYLFNDYKKGLDVNHKNGNRKDNRIENLEFVTRQQNVKHGFDVLNRKINMDRLNISVLQYDLQGNFIAKHKSITEATKSMNGGSKSNISKCVKGKTKTAYKYMWKREA